MSERQGKRRLRELRQAVAHHDTLYYKNAQPEISDFEYDRLKREFTQLEAEYSDASNAPVRAVGDDRIEGFETYTHRVPMLSLDNTYNEEELKKFDQRLCKRFAVEQLDYVVEPKIDGVALSLTYESGHFIRAVTRGNGIEGDDVTHNICTLEDLPRELTGKALPQAIEIRGEVYMTHREFERINAERETLDLSLYANPRNLAAGTLKLLDSGETARRKLEIVLYGVGYASRGFDRQSAVLQQLKDWMFPSFEQYWLVQGIDAVWGSIQELNTLRHSYPYSTDGAVVKLNRIELQKKAGATAKAPRWAIAYKFAAEQAETRLKKITIQVGRTGVLTPVAELEPIQLAGTNVARATLHNADEIARKDIREGDSVIIEKAGDIIPAVVRVRNDKRSAESRVYPFPTTCPACGVEVVRLPDETAWRCPNLSCPPQIRRRIIHYASKACMDIENLGKAVVEQLVAAGLVHSIADLYQLQVDDLLGLERFAQKSSTNLIQALELSKEKAFWRLLHGLGIPHVGQQSAKDLARYFKTLDRLMQADEAALSAVDGIGATMAKSIRLFFAEPVNLEIIRRLIDCGINTSELETTEKKGSLPLEGKTFVLTGTLPTMTRDQARAAIETAGGKVSSTVSRKTTYLLAGESPGSKFKKAEKLGVSVIDEAEFKALLVDEPHMEPR